MKTTTLVIKTLIGWRSLRSTFIIVALVCFALSKRAEAVTPPPDGGYPGGNTAEGQNALSNLSSGTYNTAVGFFSLGTLSTGQFCTGIGAGALLLNTADENTATGAGALFSDTVGFSNTANGAFALFNDTTGSNNTASGYQALFNNVDGFRNNAFGLLALWTHQTGSFNNAFGSLALESDQSGVSNNAFGDETLRSNTTGIDNTAMGDFALHDNDADKNCAFGAQSLKNNTTGSDNTASGFAALLVNTGGTGNTAIGYGALVNNTTGNSNTVLGAGAGETITTASGVICIGAIGANVSSSCYIDNIWNQPGGSQAVYVNSDGKLGAQVSSLRFKEDIKPMDKSSEALFNLKPVAFRYKKKIDPAGERQLGLVAEEVDRVNRDLVIRDKDGKPYSVRYDQVNAMLLNEFLKEHTAFLEEQQKVQTLGATVAGLVAVVKKQTTEIQKVSARLEARKFATRRSCSRGPTPRMAVNDP